jgi:hypothetical protein
MQVEQLLGRQRVVYRRDNGVGSVTSPTATANNPGTPESGLIDMRLLSECDELVVTVASSYGSVAAAWGGVAPVQMLHGLHANVQVPIQQPYMSRCSDGRLRAGVALFVAAACKRCREHSSMGKPHVASACMRCLRQRI